MYVLLAHHLSHYCTDRLQVQYDNGNKESQHMVQLVKRFDGWGARMEQEGSRKWRLEQLLRRKKAKQNISYGLLFDECIEALGEGVVILSEETSERIRNELTTAYPFTPWGRIHWNNTVNKYNLRLAADLLPALKSMSVDIGIPVYIIWGGDYPVLQTNLQKVLSALDDVLAVDFDTFVYCTSNYVIEFYHEGEITLSIERSDDFEYSR